MLKLKSLIILSSLLNAAYAQSNQSSTTLSNDNAPVFNDEESLYVIGSAEEAFLEPGSATFISKEELSKFKHTDINRVLKNVSGVYIQEEDGFGLRPNIGLRGAHPHRSKKVTIMEDGVLIGPAPYSAPAAYYFPTPLKMQAIEVFKGPSSVKYGPNSIGGAINLVTREIPKKTTTFIDVEGGTLRKIHGGAGGRYGYLASLIEGSFLETEGVKTLPNDGETGFTKKDFMLKQEFDIGRAFGVRPQKIMAKVSYSDEVSNETYLGLSDADFNTDPYQRYSASQDDKMVNDHRQYQLRYTIEPTKSSKLTTVAYYNSFERDWSKFAGFVGNKKAAEIIADPTGANEHFYNIMTGAADSVSSTNDDLIIYGRNKRSYYSTGALVNGSIDLPAMGEVYNTVSFGARYHQDSIRRNHSEDYLAMNSGNLTASDLESKSTKTEKDVSKATTLFVQNEMTWNNLIVTLGSRVEFIETKRTTMVPVEFSLLGSSSTTLMALEQENQDTIVVPGLGVNYQLTDSLAAIAGINKGVTIVGPGQADSVKPEESINYEAGFKYNGLVNAEAIGFFSDYSNIKGTCSFSTGCDSSDLDTEYNGGEAKIYGVELAMNKTFNAKSVSFPTRFSYTRTVAQFDSSTTSENADWGIGEIKAGDPLPYVPMNQIAASFGAQYKKVLGQLNVAWKGKTPDQSVALNRKYIDAHTVLDAVVKYSYDKNSNIFMKVDNVLGEDYVVSLKPYGARPGKPRMVSAGMKYTF